MRRLCFLSLLVCFACLGIAMPSNGTTDSLSRSWKSLRLEAEWHSQVGRGQHSPLWSNANRYGLGDVRSGNGYARLYLQRPLSLDSLHTWRHGFGIDFVAGYEREHNAYLHQLYWTTRYQLSEFTIGQRERETLLNHDELSTGAFVLGRNSRPVPMLQWRLYDWWAMGGKDGWLALRFHLGFGVQTDGAWQRKYLSATSQHYAMRTLYHEKSGYLRLGNPQRHTLNFIGGLEMATQFGGTIYNGGGYDKVHDVIHGGKTVKHFLYALLGAGGSDVTDGVGYANAAGNTVGAWRASLTYRPQQSQWGVRLNYDHFFDDHSAAFDEYGWLDGLVGLEFTFPRNRYVSTLLAEHIRTDYQSGPVYHDHTPQIPDQVSGVDNYYNHNLYQGWQNYGMSMGNALFTSPLYERLRTLTFTANRFRATHFGLTGDPSSSLHYRLLYTHLRSWGTYALPFDEIETQHSVWAEIDYRLVPHRLGFSKNWKKLLQDSHIKLGIGIDRGTRLGNQWGVQLSISKGTWLFVK